MKLGFVSAMAVSPWGGSEEMWAAAARKTLAAGAQVVISVAHWRQPAPAIAELARSGARVVTRRRSGGRAERRWLERWGGHDRAFKDCDVICISDGAACDFIIRNHRDAIADLTRGLRIPYVVICQYNDPRWLSGEDLRERARAYFGKAAHVIFVAEHNWHLAERQLAMALPSSSVVCNPANLSSAGELSWPTPGPARFACVARLDVRYKGQDVLLEALHEPAWRERPWELRLYGSGPDEKYLRDLAAYYGLADRVHLMGQTADIRQVWLDNEVLILPSHGEGTPLSMIEAMLCGRPAVVTDVGGNAEWVRDTHNGFVAEAPTAAALGQALERCWAERPRWPDLGKVAAHTAQVRFDPDCGGRVLSILEQAAAKRPE